MISKFFRRAERGLTVLLAAVLLLFVPACDNGDDDRKSPSATLSVSPESITLGAAAGASVDLTVTTSAAWSATPTGEGFTVTPGSGTGNATLLVSATAANNDSEARQLGQITISATGAETPCTVIVRQEGATPEPLPITEVITVDFAQGPDITTPALPSASADALSGRHEYTIDGRTFAIYANADNNGKFYWNNQAQYYDAPEPNKALYFSKEDAYVEFPAVDGKVLSAIEYIHSTGAGEVPDFDITTTAGASMDYSLDYGDGSSMTFTLLAPTLNTRYRLTIRNKENAQPAKFVLTYMVPQL